MKQLQTAALHLQEASRLLHQSDFRRQPFMETAMLHINEAYLSLQHFSPDTAALVGRKPRKSKVAPDA